MKSNIMKKLLKKLLFELEYKRDYAYNDINYYILNSWCCLLKKLIKKFTKRK